MPRLLIFLTDNSILLIIGPKFKVLLMKKSAKESRKQRVLFGLVDLYIKQGRPVGSNTLRQEGLEDLSSATIRNYFSQLEEEELLSQQHTSGGRVPTAAAYRLYAKEWANTVAPLPKEMASVRTSEEKEIATYLQRSAEVLSHKAQCAIFLSAPRFDHDFVSEIKIVPLDVYRSLCILITDFGVIHTEIFHSQKKTTTFSAKRMEQYFHWRLTGNDEPLNMTPDEEETAQALYNEVMLRYIVGYAHFEDEAVYRTGFSHVLNYPEFHDPKALAQGLALFENGRSMRLLLREAAAHEEGRCWIGDDLEYYTQTTTEAGVIAAPYRIHQQIVGAVGLLGPMRLPYKRLFPLLTAFCEAISETLTRNVYKHKITYRQPHVASPYLPREEQRLIGSSQSKLLETTKESVKR